MRPDIKAMQRFRQCRDLAMVSPELTHDDRRAHAQRVAEQAARDDAARAGSPQMALSAHGRSS